MPRTNKSRKSKKSQSSNKSSNSNTPTASNTDQINIAPAINLDVNSSSESENEMDTAVTTKNKENEKIKGVYEEWHSNSLLNLQVNKLSNVFVNSGFVQGYTKIGCYCLIFVLVLFDPERNNQLQFHLIYSVI